MGQQTPPHTTRWAWLTSEAGSAHVLELLLVELPLLAVERQRAAPAVVGGAQSDHLLIRPLQEVGPWLVLEIRDQSQTLSRHNRLISLLFLHSCLFLMHLQGCISDL